MAAAASHPKNRLERFRAVRMQLDPSGDPAAVLPHAYVELPSSIGARLTAELALAPSSSHLLVGGVGSGKTTEILAAQRGLEALDDGFSAVYLDVSKQHDITKMRPGAVIVQVGIALAQRMDGKLVQEKQRLIEIAHGYQTQRWYEDDDGDFESVPGILSPPDVFDDDVIRALIPLRPVVALMRETRPHIVVLIDGLDRMTDMAAFDRIASHDVKALNGLGIGVVFVGPLRALYGLDRIITQRFDTYQYQPWIDLAKGHSGREFLSSVLARRIGDDLLDPDVRDALVGSSGGVMRDLLSLAQAACVEAYMSGADKLGLDEATIAINTFGRKHLQGIRPSEAAALKRVHQLGDFVQTSEEDLALLMTRRVLEYRDERRVRYAVHPTIEPLLDILG